MWYQNTSSAALAQPNLSPVLDQEAVRRVVVRLVDGYDAEVPESFGWRLGQTRSRSVSSENYSRHFRVSIRGQNNVPDRKNPVAAQRLVAKPAELSHPQEERSPSIRVLTPPPNTPSPKGASRKRGSRQDLRRRHTSLEISATGARKQHTYEQASDAFRQAQLLGVPLNWMLTMRPTWGNETPQQREAWFTRRIEALQVWAKRQGIPWAALASREAKRVLVGRTPGGRPKYAAEGEHAHILLNIPNEAMRARMQRMLRKSLSGPNEVHFRPADQYVRVLDDGRRGNGFTYCAKACPRAVRDRGAPHRYSGPIFGRRLYISEEIAPRAIAARRAHRLATAGRVTLTVAV